MLNSEENYRLTKGVKLNYSVVLGLIFLVFYQLYLYKLKCISIYNLSKYLSRT